MIMVHLSLCHHVVRSAGSIYDIVQNSKNGLLDLAGRFRYCTRRRNPISSTITLIKKYGSTQGKINSTTMADTNNTAAAAHSAGNNNTVAAIHVGTPSPDFQEWACLPRSTSMNSPTYIRVGGMSIHQHYHAWAMNGEFKKIIRSQNMIDVARRFISCV